MPAQTINWITGAGGKKGLDAWTKQGHPQLAGYAAWLVADHLAFNHNAGRASSVIDQAVQLELAYYEPLLALTHASNLATQGQLAKAHGVAIVALADLTTDDGYALLDAWLHGPYEEMLGRSSITRTLVLTTPCSSRPPGRERPNRFKW